MLLWISRLKIPALHVYALICWEENSSTFLLIFTGSFQRRRSCKLDWSETETFIGWNFLTGGLNVC